MHTKITHLQYCIWFAIIAGHLVVGSWAYWRRNSALALYLGVAVVKSLALFAVAHMASAQAYFVTYWAATFVDYGAQAYLVVSLFQAIRKTGIPNRHSVLLQVFASCLFAVAILTARFPLENIANVDWMWFLAINRVALNWIALMLIAAPLYAYMVDSAKDARLLLIYVGFALYVAARSGAVDVAIRTHLAVRFTHATEIAYVFSLVLWLFSSQYSAASHQWDPAQTDALKTALRAKSRGYLHELSRHERSLY